MDPASQQPAAHNGAWPTRAGDAVIVRTNPSNQPRLRAENPTQIRSRPVLVQSAPTCRDSHSSSDRAHSIQQIDSSFRVLPSQADHEPAPSSQPTKSRPAPSASRQRLIVIDPAMAVHTVRPPSADPRAHRRQQLPTKETHPDISDHQLQQSMPKFDLGRYPFSRAATGEAAPNCPFHLHRPHYRNPNLVKQKKKSRAARKPNSVGHGTDYQSRPEHGRLVLVIHSPINFQK
ncbi:hypothetical protein ACLOJK_034434 [Asimina triloba]